MVVGHGAHQVEVAFEISVLVVTDAARVRPVVAVFDFCQLDAALLFHESE